MIYEIPLNQEITTVNEGAMTQGHPIYDFIALRDGLPIFTINIDPKNGICQDEEKFTLVSGFLQAITSFADTLDNLGEVDELQMTGLVFSFKKIQLNKSELLFVISTGQSLDKILRKIIIDEVSSTFLHMYQDILAKEWNGDVQPFRKFKPTFEDIIEKILINQREIINEYDPDRTIKITQSFHIFDSDQEKQEQFEIQSKKQRKNPLIANESSISPMASSVSTRFLKYKAQKPHIQQMHSQMQSPPKNPFKSLSKSYGSYPFIPQIPQKYSNELGEKFNYYAPPVPKRNGNQVFSPYLDGSLYIPAISFDGKINNDSFNTEKFLSQKTNTGIYSDKIHPTVFDLVPNRRILRAGDLHKSFLTPWAQVLMVSLDGTKSIKDIAQQLELQPFEVLQLCQNLEDQNYLYFLPSI